MESGRQLQTPWLRSPWWDGFWLLSGIWLLLPALLYSIFPETIRIGFAVATLLLWLSHRFATAYTAYCTESFREIVTMQWGRFIVTPALVFTVVLAVLFAPQSAIGASFAERLLFFGTLFFIFNGWKGGN